MCKFRLIYFDEIVGYTTKTQKTVILLYAHFIFRWSPGKPGHFTKVSKLKQASKAFHEILLFLELPKLCKNVLEELPCGGLYFDQKWTPPAFRLTLDPTAKLLSFQLIFQLVNCWKMSQTLVGKWDRIMRRFHCWMIEIIQWYYNCCRRKWCCLPWFFVNFSLEDYENERWRQRDYDYCRLTESHFMPVTDNWELYGGSWCLQSWRNFCLFTFCWRIEYSILGRFNQKYWYLYIFQKSKLKRLITS